MRIRFKVIQPTKRSPCEHQFLTLKGRYQTLKGIDIKRSRECYTCNTCGKPGVRTLNPSASYLAPDHLAAETSPFSPFDTGN
jgi:hypothetical protein